MFNIFKSKTDQKSLQAKYDRLMEQVYKLENNNPEAAEFKKREAQGLLLKIVQMGRA